jgi:dihydrofolate reductase
MLIFRTVPNNVLVFSSLESALDRVKQFLMAPPTTNNPDTHSTTTDNPPSSATVINPSGVWIIGGGSIYKQALDHPNCQRLFITRVWRTNDEPIECDAFFPEINRDVYRLASDETLTSRVMQAGDSSFLHTRVEGQFNFKFELYERERVINK